MTQNNNSNNLSDIGDNESEKDSAFNSKQSKTKHRKSNEAPIPSDPSLVSVKSGGAARNSNSSFTATSASTVIAQVRRVISDCKRLTTVNSFTSTTAADAPGEEEVIDPQQFVDQLKRIVDEGHATLDEHEAAVVASYLRVFGESWTTRTQQSADEIERLQRELTRKRVELSESKTRLREKQERLSSVVDLSAKKSVAAADESAKQKKAKQGRRLTKRRLAEVEIPYYVSVFLSVISYQTCHEYYIDKPRAAVEIVITNVRKSTDNIQASKLGQYQQQLKTLTLTKKQTLVQFVAQRQTKIDRILPQLQSREARLLVAVDYVKIVQQEIRRIKATVRGGRAYIQEAKQQQPALGNSVDLRQQQERIVPNTKSGELGGGDSSTTRLAISQLATKFFRLAMPLQNAMTTKSDTIAAGGQENQQLHSALDVRDLIKTTKRVADDLFHDHSSDDEGKSFTVDNKLSAFQRIRRRRRRNKSTDEENKSSNKHLLTLTQSQRMLRTRRQTILCRTLIACLDSVSDIFKLDVQTLYSAIDACKQHRQKASEVRIADTEFSHAKDPKVSSSSNRLFGSASSSGKLLRHESSRYHVEVPHRATLSTSRVLSKVDKSVAPKRRRTAVQKRDHGTSTVAERPSAAATGGGCSTIVDAEDELDFLDTATKLYHEVIDASSSSSSTSTLATPTKALNSTSFLKPGLSRGFNAGSLDTSGAAEQKSFISMSSMEI